MFTLNKRSIMIINANFGAGREAVPIAFVSVGGTYHLFMAQMIIDCEKPAMGANADM